MNCLSRKRENKPKPLEICISLPPKINFQGGFSVNPLAALQPYKLKKLVDIDEDLAKNKVIEV